VESRLGCDRVVEERSQRPPYLELVEEEVPVQEHKIWTEEAESAKEWDQYGAGKPIPRD